MKRLCLVGLVCCSLGAAFGSCTDTNIYVTSMEPNVPNKITVSGTVCTDDPLQRQFPVRLMFIIDTSNMMADNDQSGHRMSSVQDIVNRYMASPNYSFAIIKYGGEVIQLTDGYTKDMAVLTEAITDLMSANNCADGQCRDWKGAMSLALSVFTGDVLTSNPGTRSRTRYVFIFLASGPPDPSLGDAAGEVDLAKEWVAEFTTFGDDEGVAEVAFHTVQLADHPSTCDGMAEIRFCSDAVPCPPNCTSPGEVCLPPANLCAADHGLTCEECAGRCEFVRLCQDDGVTECVSDEECCDPYPCPDTGTRALNNHTADMLQAMAYAGMGEFISYNSEHQLNFGGINLDTTQSIFVSKAFLVTNANVKSLCGEIMTDSDADGLSDREEECYNEILTGECKDLASCHCELDVWGEATPGGTDTDPANWDTDGDGIGDMLEMVFATVNLDPLRTDLPQACYGLEKPYGSYDRDGDGLKDCEEKLLGTDLNLFDTDRDGYPDWVEFKSGSNYLRADQLSDSDLDGTPNGDELELHLDPQCNDARARAGDAYRYKLVDEGLRIVPFSEQPFLVSGVEITDLSGRSEEGAGALYFYPVGTRRPDNTTREWPSLAWRDPADGQHGIEIDITGPGIYQLFSSCDCVKDCTQECQPGTWCDPNLGTCETDPCDRISCLSTETCDPYQQRCVPDCSKSECEMGEACDPLLGKCLTDRCLNVDCSGEQTCDPESGVCISAPCEGWACGAGERVNEELKPPWIVVRVDDPDNLFPKSGFWCDGTGTTADGCTSDNDCTGNTFCRIRESIVVGLANKNCISFKVKNITLVDTLETRPGFGPGWNNVYLYFAQTPLDNPYAYSIFRAAVVPIRFHDGQKEPDVAEWPLGDGDFFAIEER
ncbi:MAG: VWA domain-containing protein [Deltaproteobacteria bacterium]|nr:VWA domain-containing protein [Deltaproteobacteria bacterium]